jgi:hypothetical protein
VVVVVGGGGRRWHVGPGSGGLAHIREIREE